MKKRQLLPVITALLMSLTACRQSQLTQFQQQLSWQLYCPNNPRFFIRNHRYLFRYVKRKGRNDSWPFVQSERSCNGCIHSHLQQETPVPHVMRGRVKYSPALIV